MPASSPTVRRRKGRVSREDTTGDDTGNDSGDAAAKPVGKQEHSKGENKRSKLIKRLFFGTLLLFVLCTIIAAGHLWTLGFVLLIQCAIFRELVNVRYRRRLEDIPYFRTSQWGWFYAAILMTYGQRLQSPARLKLIHSPMVRACLPYVDGVAVLIYSALLVGTVLTLQKGKYRYQIGQLAWTVSIVVVAVVQTISFSENILNGLFWFLFPVSLVICNDSMAYFCGMAVGKRLVDHEKRPFLGDLSPNKTWEGFIFGGLFTVLFAFLTPPLYPTPIVCPCETLSWLDGYVLGRTCEVADVFLWRSYSLPSWLSAATGLSTVNLLPMQLHALSLGLFASIVAPFGGFFASGIKRAYKLDDFASIIPGHGGVFDRVDCQLIMGLFTQTYYVTFIHMASNTLSHVLQLALALPESEQLSLHKALGETLKAQGLKPR